jgi:hypothetical protein
MTTPSASIVPAIAHCGLATTTRTSAASGTTAPQPPITAPRLVRVCPVHARGHRPRERGVDGRLGRRAVDLGDEGSDARIGDLAP